MKNFLVYTDRTTDFDFKVEVEGASLSEAKARLILSGEKTNYIFSVRRSYLQFLFSALELPFLPTFNDYQLRIKTDINKKNKSPKEKALERKLQKEKRKSSLGKPSQDKAKKAPAPAKSRDGVLDYIKERRDAANKAKGIKV